MAWPCKVERVAQLREKERKREREETEREEDGWKESREVDVHRRKGSAVAYNASYLCTCREHFAQHARCRLVHSWSGDVDQVESTICTTVCTFNASLISFLAPLSLGCLFHEARSSFIKMPPRPGGGGRSQENGSATPTSTQGAKASTHGIDLLYLYAW